MRRFGALLGIPFALAVALVASTTTVGLAGAPPKDARIVVALLDSGVNAYHPVYARVGESVDLAQFPNGADGGRHPRTIDLSTEGTYAERVAADDAAWRGIRPNELVHFRNTNLLAVYIGPDFGGRKILDVDGHGTATSSVVARESPRATVLLVQTAPNSENVNESLHWVLAQPWVDIVSISIGAFANLGAPPLKFLPVVGHAFPPNNQATKAIHAAGKLVVVAAGNEPSPLWTDELDGPPWVLSVSGSQGGGNQKTFLSSEAYPDFVSNYTVQAARRDTADDVWEPWHGTSFSCPTVAATAAHMVYRLREELGHSGGIEGGALAPGVTNRDVRTALNRTAILPEFDGVNVTTTFPQASHNHAPGAEFATSFWGQVDPRIAEAAVDALMSGNLSVPPEKLATSVYMAGTYRTREAYWQAAELHDEVLRQALG